MDVPRPGWPVLPLTCTLLLCRLALSFQDQELYPACKVGKAPNHPPRNQDGYRIVRVRELVTLVVPSALRYTLKVGTNRLGPRMHKSNIVFGSEWHRGRESVRERVRNERDGDGERGRPRNEVMVYAPKGKSSQNSSSEHRCAPQAAQVSLYTKIYLHACNRFVAKKENCSLPLPRRWLCICMLVEEL